MVYETELQSLKDRINITKDYSTSISECESLVRKIESEVDSERDITRKAEWANTLDHLQHALKHINEIDSLKKSGRDHTLDFTSKMITINIELNVENQRI